MFDLGLDLFGEITVSVIVDLAYYRQARVCLSPLDASRRLATLAKDKATSLAKAATMADYQASAFASQGARCRVSEATATRLRGLAAAADIRARMASYGCGAH